MTDVIVGKQKVKVEARLDIGLEEFDTHRVALVFIRIDEGILLPLIISLLKCYCKLKEGVGRNEVIMVDETYILTVCLGDTGIGIGTDALVLLKLDTSA